MASSSAVERACAPRSISRSRGRSDRGSSRIVSDEVILRNAVTKDLPAHSRSFASLRMTEVLQPGSERRAVALLELLARPAGAWVVATHVRPIHVAGGLRVQRACPARAHDH